MDEIFGRVTAILFAAAVFMGMPLVYMSERAKSAEQMYLLTVNTEFVDSICNTGFLTMEMYQQFYKEISAASGIYEVHMYREQKDIVLEQGDYSYESIFFDDREENVDGAMKFGIKAVRILSEQVLLDELDKF